jgi:hypothetical protein
MKVSSEFVVVNPIEPISVDNLDLGELCDEAIYHTPDAKKSSKSLLIENGKPRVVGLNSKVHDASIVDYRLVFDDWGLYSPFNTLGNMEILLRDHNGRLPLEEGIEGRYKGILVKLTYTGNSNFSAEEDVILLRNFMTKYLQEIEF